jgi:hypothetical protein
LTSEESIAPLSDRGSTGDGEQFVFVQASQIVRKFMKRLLTKMLTIEEGAQQFAKICLQG